MFEVPFKESYDINDLIKDMLPIAKELKFNYSNYPLLSVVNQKYILLEFLFRLKANLIVIDKKLSLAEIADELRNDMLLLANAAAVAFSEVFILPKGIGLRNIQATFKAMTTLTLLNEISESLEEFTLSNFMVIPSHLELFFKLKNDQNRDELFLFRRIINTIMSDNEISEFNIKSIASS